jgi:8-oxo-dGTP diphosphatase
MEALMEQLPDKEYFAGLDRKRGSAGVLFIRDGKLLVLTYSYRKGIDVPGGRIDARESPDECAVRECREEIGVEAKLVQQLAIDYYRSTPERGDTYNFTFLGELGDQEIRIDHKEVTGYKWLPVEEALTEIAKQNAKYAASLRAAIAAMGTGGGVYLKEGQPFFVKKS